MGLLLHCSLDIWDSFYYIDCLFKSSILTSSVLDDGGQRGSVEHQDKELRARRKQILEPQWLHLLIRDLIIFPFSFERSSVRVALAPPPLERFRVVEYDAAGAPSVAEDVLLRGGVGVVVFEGANRERHLWKRKGKEVGEKTHFGNLTL